MPTTRSTPAVTSSAIPSSMVGVDVLGPVADHEPARAAALQRGGQPVHLGPGALGQRGGAADGPVASHQLVEELGRGGPAPADGGVEGLDALGRGRGAVGHDQHPDAGAGTGPVGDPRHDPATPARPSAWTSATTCSRMAGSVSGRTPCPRLKMWPGAEPARRSTSRVSASATAQLARHRAGSRFPWTATPGPTRRRASSRGTRQSTPTTVAAGLGHQRQQLTGAHAEEDGGCPRVRLGQLGEEPPGGGRTSSS